MDLKVIHDTLSFYLNKENLYFSPEEKDGVLDRAQIQHFNAIKPSYAVNQQIADALLPFKKAVQFDVLSTVGGEITLPADYLHLTAIETVIMESNRVFTPTVEILSEDKVSERRNSQLIAPTFRHPIGEFQTKEDGTKQVQLYPAFPASGNLKYLRRPKAPKFIYAITDGVAVYDQTTSTQMEWDDTSMEPIIFIALGLLGLNVKDADSVSFSAAKENK